MIVTITVGWIASKIILIDDGILICESDEHPLKAEFPIKVTDDGIVICDNDEHPLKA